MSEIDFEAKAYLLKILDTELYDEVCRSNRVVDDAELIDRTTVTSYRAARLVGLPEDYESRRRLRNAVQLLGSYHA